MGLIYAFLAIVYQVHKFNEVLDEIHNFGIRWPSCKLIKSCDCMVCHMQIHEFVVPKSKTPLIFFFIRKTLHPCRNQPSTLIAFVHGCPPFVVSKMTKYYFTLTTLLIHNNFVQDVFSATQFTNGLIVSQI